ncbi:MAG: hypothetical protein AAB508_03505 [Patescibacteria group bacterium]
MAESVNESVSVDLLSNHLQKRAYPWAISWRGRRHTVKTVGLHHTTRVGRVLFHLFSVSDGTTCFRLQFDTEFLSWKLLEVSEG